jgi:hypothetical protein
MHVLLLQTAMNAVCALRALCGILAQTIERTGSRDDSVTDADYGNPLVFQSLETMHSPDMDLTVAVGPVLAQFGAGHPGFSG